MEVFYRPELSVQTLLMDANSVFEVLLKAAVIQNSMNEIEPYPPQEEIDNLQISDACDYKIRKMIKRFWRRQWFSKVQRITKKIVAVIFITVGVSFIALLPVSYTHLTLPTTSRV